MTTTAPGTSEAAAARSFKGPIIGLALLLAAAAVLFTWRGPIFLWTLWIHGADKPEYSQKILAERDEALADRLVTAMQDDGLGSNVRVAIATLLIKKDRLPLVEKALREGDLSSRAVALQALFVGRFFQQYADDPAYRVRETILEWMRRDGDDSREYAINMLNLPYLRMPEALPLIHAILSAPPGPGGAPSASWRLRIAAASAIPVYQDCEGAPLVLAQAGSDPDPQVRLRSMQAVEQLYSAEKAPCGAQLPEAVVEGLVITNLARPGDGDASRSVRMGALALLAKYPQWAKKHLDVIRAHLAPDVHQVERRAALGAFLATFDAKDPGAVDELSRWFHDPAVDVRSQAVQTAGWGKAPFDDKRFRSCFVGIVRDEVDPAGLAIFRIAIQRLRQAAGSWVGFPTRRIDAKGALEAAMDEFLKALYQNGESEGVTRATVADAWFRWLAKDAGRDPAGVESALKVLNEFWEKARAGDVAGARNVLAGPEGSSKTPGLFTYEESWVAVHEK